MPTLPKDWKESDVLALPKGEHDWLERKGSRSLDLKLPGVTEDAVRDELGRQVSAFANSGGGQMIYGLTDEGNVDNGGVSTDVTRNGTKAWLEEILPRSVESPLRAFAVHEIPRRLEEESQLEEGKALYVIDIPDSPDAPHQSARDHKYYVRIGGQSRPAPHRLIMDIADRRKCPRVEPQIAFRPVGGTPENPEYEFIIGLANRGPIRAVHYLLQVWVPQKLRATGYGVNLWAVARDHQYFTFFEVAGKADQILFPSHTVQVMPSGSGMTVRFQMGAKEWWIITEVPTLIWKIFADDTPPVEERVYLADIFT